MEPQKQKRLRGKSPETLLSEAIEDLNRLVHTDDVDEAKVQAARTRVIALKQRCSRKQQNKKADKIAVLAMAVKTLEDKVAALTVEVETLKQQQRPVEPVAPVGAVTTDSTETTLERMRRGEKVGLSSDAAMAKLRQDEPKVEPAPKLPAVSETPQRIRLTPPRPGEENDYYRRTLAVEAVFPAKSAEEQAAMDLMEKRYGDNPEANAAREERIQASNAAAQKAKEPHPDPTSPGVKEIEAEIAYENNVARLLKEANELVEKLRAQQT